MRKAFVAFLALAAVSSIAPLAFAGEDLSSEPGIVRAHVGVAPAGNGQAATATGVGACLGNNPSTACDTVWVGHVAGSYLGTGVGGNWDFDTDAAGTDSSQGFRRWAFPFTSNAAAAPTDRPQWAYDYGNTINEGNTNLWAARDLAGRKYVKTGIAGAWHSDPMTGIRKNNNPATNGGEVSAAPIDGAASAWCGLRVSGDQTAVDALTGNYINSDLWAAASGGPSTSLGDWPGYANLWDQMLYKDFASTGTGTVSARVRTDLVSFIDNAAATGSGWFNPDPTSIANLVVNPSDSMMVYVGSPKEGAFDTNRRWFSEVLDMSQPLQELYSVGSKEPITGPADTTLNLSYSGINPVGGKVRVVFRVKTNRARSDATTGTATGPNTKDGAAVIDDVQVNGGTVYGFDTAGSITARSLIPDIGADGGAWATTGRPAPSFFHIENLSNLLFEDLCGSVNSTTRRCNMRGNVVVAGDFDNSDFITIESVQMYESPTVNLAVRTAAPGTKNSQNIDSYMALRPSVVEDYDIYSGFMGLDESVFWRFGIRFFGPGSVEPVSTNIKLWSPFQVYPFIVFQPDPFCVRGSNGNAAENLSSIGVPAGAMDSLKVMVTTITQGFRFGGTNLGNTRGTYFDNIRVGLVRKGAPDLSEEIWNKYQDQFPVNETVVPADNGTFDTTTAYVRTGLNIVTPINGPGYVAGDSILCNAPYVGDGVTTGVRMDLIFRIDPGPGNYSVKGDRTSALVEKDPAHPFWATYEANAGAWGTGGTGPNGNNGVAQGSIDGGVHPAGTRWNKDWWNSCRMDSAETNIYPVTSRGISVPTSPVWMGTIHEADPKFAALAIAKKSCFLSNPNGAPDVSNIDCGDPTAGGVRDANGYLFATEGNYDPTIWSSGAYLRKEGTKIIPDGYLSPGAHVEYFLRRSLIENQAVGAAQLLFDTTTVFPQDPGGNTDFDAERWSSFDVLPDLWKSNRFGGAGLACMLMIDGNDRRGADPQYRGAADSLGYGKTNGATSGWHVVDPSGTNGAGTTGRGPNNPAGFVAANLGQYGLNYDHYDIKASESGEAGHPGARLASIQAPGNSDLRRTDKSGPSPAQLATFYTTVLHLAGDLNITTLDDKITSQEQADDITLYDTYLNGASSGNNRGVWLSGDGIMEDAFNLSAANFNLFLINDFGSDLSAGNYKALSASTATTVGFLPTASWAHPGRVYGFNHQCVILSDVLALQGTVAGATEAAQYQNFAGPGPWTASIYRPVAPGTREFKTLIDGFDMSNVKGDYASLAAIPGAPESDNGRINWFDDVVTNHFAICARKGPIVGVGDLPGVEGSQFSNRNLGSFPNPAFAGRNVTLRFTLAKTQNVTVRIYNVAGREVANFTKLGLAAGPNTVVWDGKLSNGAKAMPGVYFYAIDGVNFVKDGSKAQKMILLGANSAE